MHTWSSLVLKRKFSGLRSRWQMLCSLWQYSIALLWSKPQPVHATRDSSHVTCSVRCRFHDIACSNERARIPVVSNSVIFIVQCDSRNLVVSEPLRSGHIYNCIGLRWSLLFQPIVQSSRIWHLQHIQWRLSTRHWCMCLEISPADHWIGYIIYLCEPVNLRSLNGRIRGRCCSLRSANL